MVASVPTGSPSTALVFYLGLLSLWISWCQGLDISYCSPANNAGSNPGMYSQFQSNGLCQDHCQGSFAFAVLQGYWCWCSNYIPTPQQSTLDCNQECPGFDEWCGSTEAGLYGYYLLSAGVPLGTSGSNTPPVTSSLSSSTSSVSSHSSTPVSTSLSDPGSTKSSRSLVVWPGNPSSAVVTPGSSQSTAEASPVTWSSGTLTYSTSSIAESTSTPPSQTESSPTPTPTEVYTSITTVTGEVRTVIVTPTPAASSDATLGQSSTGGGGVSAGKVAGIVLGVALGIGFFIGVAVWIWFRRRHRQSQTQAERGPETAYVPRTGENSPSNNTPSRQVSQLSSSGLLGSRAPRLNLPAGLLTSDSRSTDAGTLSASDRRSVGTDQRLNPYALYMSEQGRISNVSLQDNHDYSRQLRVANPDD